MVRRLLVSFTVLLIAISLSANAEDFAGDYNAQTEEGLLVLSLQAGGVGRYTGVLSLNGYDMPVIAAIRGDKLRGEVSDGGESFMFEASLVAGFLNLVFQDGDRVVLERGRVPSDRFRNSAEATADTISGMACTLVVTTK